MWSTLCFLLHLRMQSILMLLGLVVALSLPGPLTTLLVETGIWPLGHGILVRAAAVLGVLALWFGLRSSGLGRLRRRWQVGW